MLVWVYTCQNATLLEITCHGSSYILTLSYDVASGSEITPCNKIYKSLVVYRFTEML